MSIKIMSMIWDDGPAKQSERFVLLALADYANDQGECWPSIAGIARKTCLTERGVQKILRRLSDDGWLLIEVGTGRKNCNIYTVKTPNDVHPEQSSPPNLSAETPNLSAENPEQGSPEPSLTINKPSVSRGDIVHQHLIAWAGGSAVRSFIEYRRKMRKPLTETAAMRQAEQLKKIFQAGGDTDDALGMAEEKGWRSVQADWYFNAKGKRDGQSNYSGQSPQGRDNGADPALEQIARLARLR